VGVENIDSLATEKSPEPDHAQRVLNTACAIATKALHTLRLHVIAQPGLDRIERGEEHLVAASIMPFSELREEAAGVAVLSKVQDSLH
jgi:hypothetical protein